MKTWWKTLRGHPLRILWTLIMLGVFALVAVLRVGTIHRLPFTILLAIVVLVYLFSYAVWRAWDDMVAQQAAERAREIVEEAIPLPTPAPTPPPAPAPEPITVPLHPAIGGDTPRVDLSENDRTALLAADLFAHQDDDQQTFADFLMDLLEDPIAAVALANARRPCIPLQFEEMPDDQIPVGASKTGGMPDLPPSVPYPVLSERTEVFTGRDEQRRHHPETPMQLVLQLALEDVDDPLGRLPKQGMLYLFWSGEVVPLEDHRYVRYVFQGPSREHFRAFFYLGDKSVLQRTPPPCAFDPDLFDGPFESARITPSRPFWDLDPEVWGRALDTDGALEELVWEGDKLFGFPERLVNASPPSPGWESLLQFRYAEGCLWGLWWYVPRNSLRDGVVGEMWLESDVD